MKAIILTLILLGAILVGCVRDEPPSPPPTPPSPPTTPQPNETEPPQITTFETCQELGGHECDFTEDCPGEWLNASDTFNCCSTECNSTQLEIPPFEPTPEDEDLGNLT